MQYHISHNGKYFDVSAHGKGHLKDFIDYSLSIFAHPKWQPGSDVCVDFTKADLADITIGEIIELSKELINAKEHWGACRLSHFVNRDEEFGMVRMFMQWVDGKWEGEMRVYRSEEQARAWLATELSPDQ